MSHAETRIAPFTIRSRAQFKGQPMRYLQGHARRRTKGVATSMPRESHVSIPVDPGSPGASRARV